MATNATITELENLKKELLERVEHIDKTIHTLKSISFSPARSFFLTTEVGKKTNGSSKYSDYDINVTMRNKIAYILKKENRFLHVREIASILHSIEPGSTEQEYIAKLSPAISALKKQGAIIRVQVGKSNLNIFWGSKNWVDENGNPKEHHRYDKKQLSTFGKEEIEIE